MNLFKANLTRGWLVVLLAALFAAPVMAHPGHGDPISREAAVQRAASEISRLVSAGKLDQSWKLSATLKTAELRTNGDTKEWALTFANPQVANAEEQILFVYLSETGEYLAANFTGA